MVLHFSDRATLFLTRLALDSIIISTILEIHRQLLLHWKHTGNPVIIVATVESAERVPAHLLNIFKQIIKFEVRAFARMQT